jgi:4-amino-4-deoxy-L-arabinose transferase-like glycosyltransferase
VVSPRVERLAVALLLGGFVLLASGGLREQSVTVDEYAHLPAGCAALRDGTLELYGKNPPLVRYLLAAPALLRGARVPTPALPTRGAGWDPWRYGDAFVEANAGPRGLGSYPEILTAARLAGVVLGVLLLVLLYGLARRQHGPAGALVSLYLLALSPTLLAHAPLVTTDAGGALFFLLALAACAAALRAPGPARFAGAGAAIGAAIAAKFTALLLLPLFVAWGWIFRRAATPDGPRRWMLRWAAFVLALWATLVLVYQADRPWNRLGGFEFASRAGRVTAGMLPTWTPVPLPAALVQGIDAQALDLEQAEMPNYLAGNWSRRGWWYYYPVALVLKTPLALWGLVGMAALLALRHRGGTDARDRVLPVVVASAGGALLLAAMRSHLDIGVRYLLPALPTLFLLLGSLPRLVARGRALRWTLAVMLALYGVASLAAYPRYLTFFSTLAGGEAGGHRYLLNSNNDWGQDLGRLARWLRDAGIDGPIGLAYFGHMDPTRYGIEYELAPDHPRPGWHAVSLNLLFGMPYVVVDHGTWRLLGQDLVRPQHRYAWLRGREPVARIGGTIWVYRVPDASGAAPPPD